MTKVYFIVICILIALPVAIAATTIVYTCFKLSNLAGFIAIAVCVAIIILAVLFVLKKINEKEGD